MSSEDTRARNGRNPRMRVLQGGRSNPCAPERVRLGSHPGRGLGRGVTFAFDDDYVRRLADGDPSVERHFVDYFGRLLYIKLRRRLGPSSDVEDVRQETFARVFSVLRDGAGIRDSARFGSFVNSVCENVLRERARQRYYRPEGQEPEANPRDQREDPASELVHAELVRQVRAVVRSLPRRDRELLEAVFFEERDRDEVCKRFGVERGYLRVVLHRAKERFRTGYLAARVDRFPEALDDVADERTTSAG